MIIALFMLLGCFAGFVVGFCLGIDHERSYTDNRVEQYKKLLSRTEL